MPVAEHTFRPAAGGPDRPYVGRALGHAAGGTRPSSARPLDRQSLVTVVEDGPADDGPKGAWTRPRDQDMWSVNASTGPGEIPRHPMTVWDRRDEVAATITREMGNPDRAQAEGRYGAESSDGSPRRR